MAELHEYECPACGGVMEFDIGTQQLKCPYCGSEVNIDEYEKTLEAPTEPIREEGWSREELEGMKVYTCQSCGAEIVAEEATGAAACPYCGNNVMMTRQFSGDLKPEFIIPFQLDKKAAVEGYRRHIQGKCFLPKLFKSQNHIDEIKSIYVPFWLFDVEAHVNMDLSAENEKDHEEDDEIITTHYEYDLRRCGTIAMDKIPTDGSKKIDDTLMEAIEPFDFSMAVPFKAAYLAGYLADRYDVDPKDREKRLLERVKVTAENAFKNSVEHYDFVHAVRSAVTLQNTKSHYVLYPVWLLNTSWNGKKFTFAMNGQTGKMVGDLPFDRKSFWFWTLLLSAVSSGLLWAAVSFIISWA